MVTGKMFKKLQVFFFVCFFFCFVLFVLFVFDFWKSIKLSVGTFIGTTQIFTYCLYNQNTSSCKKIAVHMSALTYFIGHMQIYRQNYCKCPKSAK